MIVVENICTYSVHIYSKFLFSYTLLTISTSELKTSVSKIIHRLYVEIYVIYAIVTFIFFADDVNFHTFSVSVTIVPKQ